MAKAKQVEDRARQANWQRNKLAVGLCPRCGQERLDNNPRTGKSYALGPKCRKLKAETQKLLMQSRRASGRAPA